MRLVDFIDGLKFGTIFFEPIILSFLDSSNYALILSWKFESRIRIHKPFIHFLRFFISDPVQSIQYFDAVDWLYKNHSYAVIHTFMINKNNECLAYRRSKWNNIGKPMQFLFFKQLKKLQLILYRRIHQLNWNKFNNSYLSLIYASTEIAGFI